MNRGVFISFEGSEGCGKSTQIRLLREKPEAAGLASRVTREPGGTELGEWIRHVLKHAPEGRAMTPETELLLFAASRAQLVGENIRNWLEEGTHVIADRFLDSTVVYQGHARGLPLEGVRAINDFAVGNCRPDTTFLLDLDAETGLRRARNDASRREEWDRMETEELAFYETVRRSYLKLAEAEPERFVVLDAERPPEELSTSIWTFLQDRHHGVFI